MADNHRNYLLGYGERLTEAIARPPMRPDKHDPYTFEKAAKRLLPRLDEVNVDLMKLPEAACPNDEAVIAVTMHPAYLAKSYFPTELFNAVGLYPLGSRSRVLIPNTVTQKDLKDKPLETSDIYVAGPRQRFKTWSKLISEPSEDFPGIRQIIRLEDLHVPLKKERILPMISDNHKPLLEIVLHASAEADYVLEGFRQFMYGLGVTIDLDKRIHVDGLCFLPAIVPLELFDELAQFSFLRIAREMPHLRIPKAQRGIALERKFQLPEGSPADEDLRVAVFDGGLPAEERLTEWVEYHEPENLATSTSDAEDHGLAVTSALLFGPIEEGIQIGKPYCFVDHYRVLDKNTAYDPQGHYFELLNRIVDVLSQKRYDAINLSIGPDLPIEDHEVHVWTAKLDQLLSHGQTLVCVAAGNSGERDWDVGNARIQAPSDGVNLLGIGSADTLTAGWTRAGYSSVGPGRSPGIVKPDVLAFGGSDREPFFTLARNSMLTGITGTSFASPLALRNALGIRAALGPVIQPMALKALLIHHAENNGHNLREVGWGRIPSELDTMLLCPEGVVHILYQGVLEPGKYIRAKIPYPDEQIKGEIKIRATFCYATETDPQNSIHYTKAGLEIVFRPHSEKKTDPKQRNADSAPFFGSNTSFLTEAELRQDAHKWESVMKREVTKRGTSLLDPVFDIHYNARSGGGPNLSAKPIPYALVITLDAKNLPEIYDTILLKYRTQLEALRPRLELPITIGGTSQ